MTDIRKKNRFRFDEAAVYRIVVQGHVSESKSEYLGGMSIGTAGHEGQMPVTTLSGCLRDQAALLGVLATLYEMHLPILNVKKLNPADSAAAGTQDGCTL
jgi:hypothetical protein